MPAEATRFITTIYPNPTSGTFIIQAPVIINSVIVTDVIGSTKLSLHPMTQQATLNLSNYPKGMYIIKINDIYTEKIVRE
ncbi:MAG: T9SS type A sorting domain-containing protein [Taibaiella sp.]|nr:T9SS type A sorting domain-containing protein [Taibaiella sp.]